MGCKVLDFLPLRQNYKEIVVNYVKENYDFFNDIGNENYKNIYNELFNKEIPNNIYGTTDKIFDVFSKNNMNCYRGFKEFAKFIEDCIVPTTQKYNDGRYELLKRNLPLANFQDVKQLAENLKMVIIPVEYSDKKIMFGDDLKLSAMYDIVKSNNENLYMMCPIDFYNSYCHIRDYSKNSNRLMIYPDEFKAQFENFNSMLPIFSHLINKVEEHDESIQALNFKVSDLSHRVDILENISKERREEEVRKLNEINFTYKDLDPMIFSLEGEDCRIHMMWGKDLPDILLENSKLKVFKENSKLYPNQFFEFVYPNLVDSIDKNLEISNKISKFKDVWNNELISKLYKELKYNCSVRVLEEFIDFDKRIPSQIFKDFIFSHNSICNCSLEESYMKRLKQIIIHSDNDEYKFILSIIRECVDEFSRLIFDIRHN